MNVDLAAVSQSVSPAFAGVLVLAFGAGYAAGYLHFRTLHSVVRRILAGDLTAFLLQIARLLALGLLFWLIARQGAAVLLAALAGTMTARSQALAREREVP